MCVPIVLFYNRKSLCKPFAFFFPDHRKSFLEVTLSILLKLMYQIVGYTTTMPEGSSHFLNRAQLMKLRQKAIRAGVWFRALPRIDRVLVDLTIKVAENIRSTHLAKSIYAVVGKLDGLLESSVLKSLRLIGRPLAEKISSIAQKMGNVSASTWASDSSFAFFLAVMHTNR
jgi:uncharacterized membrane protein